MRIVSASAIVMLGLASGGCFLNPNYEMATDRTRSVQLILDSVEVQHLISQQESCSQKEEEEIDRFTQDILRFPTECSHPGETCPDLEEIHKNAVRYIPERSAFLDAMAREATVTVPPNSYCRVIRRSLAKCTKNPQYTSTFVKVRITTGRSKGTEGWGCEEDVYTAWPML
jgi:hypothetical protein